MNRSRDLIIRAAMRYGAMSRAQKMTVIGAPVAAVVMVTGCNPMWVTVRNPDGTPREVTILNDDHSDDQPINDFDRLCALALTVPGVPHAELCIFWNPPRRDFWHRHDVGQYLGPEGKGYWIVSEGEYHRYYSCTYWPFNGNCGYDNDPGRFAAITSEVGSGI